MKDNIDVRIYQTKTETVVCLNGNIIADGQRMDDKLLLDVIRAVNPHTNIMIAHVPRV